MSPVSRPGPARARGGAEALRLEEDAARRKNWKRWGPYLSHRQWGTVREDYSADGDAWSSFPFSHARSRAYRWGEDGILGWCDRHQLIAFAPAFWNGSDPIVKERLFGLAGPEGNHGEDVKELYYYLDGTPTHSYMKGLYKYPQGEFPYAWLLAENQRRGREQPEFEILDTGIFDQDRYFDVFVEYAKASPDDTLIRITAVNRGPDAAALELLPTIWYRNVWSWGRGERRPQMREVRPKGGLLAVDIEQETYGRLRLWCEGKPELLFTENDTNAARLWGAENASPYVKDGIDEHVVRGIPTVNPAKTGTKAAARYRLRLFPGSSAVVRLRLNPMSSRSAPFGPEFDRVFDERIEQAEEFYETTCPSTLSADARSVQRQAYAGMFWCKQYYGYEVRRWLEGDPGQTPPPPERLRRNAHWKHLYNADVLSMPDDWEFPWYAAWDHAFHCVTLALVDPDLAKQQLVLLTREWYMHPNGQLPAYEWAFSDVNPPVEAWAAYRVFKIERKRRGQGDRKFLVRMFHKLLLNFTWWVNRKDASGSNVFEGGFLGLDNVGVFDRSHPPPLGGVLLQSDGTSWMGMYCLSMGAIALELAVQDPAYEDVASKFFEHFVNICAAMNGIGAEGVALWNQDDGFFYDVISFPGGPNLPLKIRSMVGLIPLFAVGILEPEVAERFPAFRRRLEWFLDHRPDFAQNVTTVSTEQGPRRLLSLVNADRLPRVLSYLLDEAEFLSDYGVRSLSRVHRDHPYELALGEERHRVEYEPAESRTGTFGGNSNWRGPIWFPVNFLIIESLQKFHHFLGDSYRVEFPKGSGTLRNLWEIASEISRRLSRIFLRDSDGRRAVYGAREKLYKDPHFRDYVHFHEYFHGDTGEGLGASHQTGWTGLVAKLLDQSGE